EGAADSGIEAVLLTGGTGIAPRDSTYEAVESLLDKTMPGFGEIFRYLSFAEDIGTAAILSRAVAGTVGSTAVFSMPGSVGAVKLAMTRLILPELRHVMREIYKSS
ncbi:molybdenum cofactor biosynthesis protein B, partial [Paenibacillus forsythiae]|uniref:MogA/MoaB family molybdenum cofactor biosynthesis protein n=1 Tax=Paenibacillus forsythiae TaxID=365616 RepID=UPI0004706E25